MPTECVICTEHVFKASKEPAALACGHLFHEPCIRQWFATNPHKRQCPTCKQTSAQAMARNSGIIRLYLDLSGGLPAASNGGAGAAADGDSSIDNAGDDASGEIALLKHGLLYAQRELQDQKRKMEDVQKHSRAMQDALRVEADKARSLWSQLQSATTSVRQAEANTRSRDGEIERLKRQIDSEKEELARARSLQAASDALELEREVVFVLPAPAGSWYLLTQYRRGCAGGLRERSGHTCTPMRQRGARATIYPHAKVQARSLRETRGKCSRPQA